MSNTDSSDSGRILELERQLSDIKIQAVHDREGALRAINSLWDSWLDAQRDRREEVDKLNRRVDDLDNKSRQQTQEIAQLKQVRCVDAVRRILRQEQSDKDDRFFSTLAKIVMIGAVIACVIAIGGLIYKITLSSKPQCAEPTTSVLQSKATYPTSIFATGQPHFAALY